MENYVIIGLVIFAIVLLKLVVSNNSTKRKVFKNNEYNYSAKKSANDEDRGRVFH